VGFGNQEMDLPRRGNQLPVYQPVGNSGILMIDFKGNSHA
jgi:hypothetical protein